jgi:hypothetical protein
MLCLIALYYITWLGFHGWMGNPLKCDKDAAQLLRTNTLEYVEDIYHCNSVLYQKAQTPCHALYDMYNPTNACV